MTTSVLLIDDDPICNFTLRRMIGAAGLDAQLDWIDRADKALNRLGDCPRVDLPEMVFLDVNMPGMSGIEFLRRVRRTPVLRRLEICMLTGTFDQANFDAAMSLGVAGYVDKTDDGRGYRNVIDRISNIAMSCVEHGLVA